MGNSKNKYNNLISVIVPIYNAEKYLAECLESISKQSYKNLEVLLIDDESLDGSAKICKEFCDKDTRFRYKKIKHSGQSVARNEGVSLSHGEWIAFVDNDDVLECNMYEKLLHAAIKHNTKISFCDINKYDNKGEILSFGTESKNLNSINLINEILLNVPLVVFAVWNKVYHRTVIDNIKFIENCEFEDILYSLDSFFCTQKVYYVHDVLYNWRIHHNQLSQNYNGIPCINALEEVNKTNIKLNNIQGVPTNNIIYFTIINRTHLISSLVNGKYHDKNRIKLEAKKTLKLYTKLKPTHKYNKMKLFVYFIYLLWLYVSYGNSTH